MASLDYPQLTISVLNGTQQVPELLPYLILIMIIEINMYLGVYIWLGYDRSFRQRGAADPKMSWAMIGAVCDLLSQNTVAK